jgi:hypothetical protein
MALSNEQGEVNQEKEVPLRAIGPTGRKLKCLKSEERRQNTGDRRQEKINIKKNLVSHRVYPPSEGHREDTEKAISLL